jgi:hypothetical protein
MFASASEDSRFDHTWPRYRALRVSFTRASLFANVDLIVVPTTVVPAPTLAVLAPNRISCAPRAGPERNTRMFDVLGTAGIEWYLGRARALVDAHRDQQHGKLVAVARAEFQIRTTSWSARACSR